MAGLGGSRWTAHVVQRRGTSPRYGRRHRSVQVCLHDLVEDLLVHGGVFDRNQCFHPAVEVAGPIGRRDEHRGLRQTSSSSFSTEPCGSGSGRNRRTSRRQISNSRNRARKAASNAGADGIAISVQQLPQYVTISGTPAAASAPSVSGALGSDFIVAAIARTDRACWQGAASRRWLRHRGGGGRNRKKTSPTA